MSTVADQAKARHALAVLVHCIRNGQWQMQGITAAIEQLHRDRQPLGAIAKAAINAALTPSTQTPGGIAARVRDGFDGSTDLQPATPTPEGIDGMTCTKCGQFVPASERPVHAENCRPRAQDQSAARKAAFAAARNTRTDTEEDTP